MNRHVIVHQFDPTRHVVGGIDGLIRDLVEHAGEQHRFAILGVERESGRLGRWRRVTIGRGEIEFMPVVALEAGNQTRRVPHSLRVTSGLLRYRPEIGSALVHSHRAELGVAASLLYRGAPRIQFIHGDAREAFRWREETIWRFAPRLYEALETVAVRRAAATVVMSRSALARLRRHSPNALLGTNWFDARHFHPRERQRGQTPVVGWAGRLEPPKDPVGAIRVFAELRRREVPFEAWLAGTGTLEHEVKSAIRDLGLESTVRVLGVLEPDLLGAELRRTGVFLMTSLWEGIPRMTIEALACGVPVVSTSVGEVAAFVRDGVNGYVVPSSTTAALADAVAAALELEPGASVAQTVEHLEVGRVVPDLLAQLVAATR